MSAHEVMVWSVTPGLLSEGPHWHEEHQELLWVDILGRQMHRGTLTPMAPWNALRQSRSTGTSARSRRLPGAGTCSPQARDSCSLFLTCRAPLRGWEVDPPASAIAVIRLPHGGPVTSDLACDVAPPVTAGPAVQGNSVSHALPRRCSSESSRYVVALRSIAARSCSKD